jgi:type II secretory pathway component GspD/PulD (secretin)
VARSKAGARRSNVPAARARYSRGAAPGVRRGPRAALALLAAVGVAWNVPAVTAAAFGPGSGAALSALLAPAQTQPRPSRAHVALNTGIECNRRGEYEQAAVLFQQARDGWADLTPAEQDELVRWIQSNAAALQARRDGTLLLAQADEALRGGHTVDAAELLKKVLANQYLSPADKQKAMDLAEKARPRGGVPTPAGPMPGTPGNPAALSLARGKLQQARAFLAQGNFDAAQQLADEALKLNAMYMQGEDDPSAVLNDIYRARRDPKALLAAARAALKRGEYDRAETLAQMSAKADSSWNMHLWGDSPAQVLKEVQAARARTGTAGVRAPASTNGPAGPQPPMSQAGGLVPVSYPNAGNTYSTSNKADLSTGPRPTPPAPPTAPAPPDMKLPDDPRAMLRLARQMYAAGDLDRAAFVAGKAKAKAGGRWGIFEDSPDKLLQEIDEARAQHDRDESVKLLAHARHLYEQGEYDAASREAYRAQKLHGPYSWWDLSERPMKLIAEIEAARSKNRRSGANAAPSPDARPPIGSAAQDPRAGQARQLIAEARQALQRGDVVRADALARQAEQLSSSLDRREDQVQLVSLRQEIASAQAGGPAAPPPAPSVPYAMSAQPPLPSAGPAHGNPAKAQAVQLLAQCRALQHEGRLVEARQKALAAQALHAGFTPAEDSPELALLQLSALAYKQVDGLMQRAADYQQTAAGNPANSEKAEHDLNAARQLAAGFGFDTSQVDSRLRGLAQLRSPAGGPPPAGAPDGGVRLTGGTTTAAPGGAGQALLAEARRDLRKGDTPAARKAANDVYLGPYGLRAEAEALLRSIDAEEDAQRRLAADRTFEAGMSAFRRKDYSQAALILRTVDPRLLGEEKQSRMKNLFALPEMQPGHVAQLAAADRPHGPDEGMAHVSDQPPTARDDHEDLLRITQAMQDIKFQQLRQEGLDVQRRAAECFRTGDTERAVEMLQEYAQNLSTVQLDNDRLALLRRPIESRLLTFRTLKAQRDYEGDVLNRGKAVAESHHKMETTQRNKEEKVAQLMEQYNAFYKDGKYKEAEMYAMAAFELDPDNAAAGAAVKIARIQRRQVEYQQLKDRKEDYFVKNLDDAEDPGDVVDPKVGVKFDAERTREIMKRRKEDFARGIVTPTKNDKEKELDQLLTRPVTLSFKDEPLDAVLQDLRDWHGVNIVADQPALDSEGITLRRPVNIQLDGVSLKSALDLLLHQVHLTYVNQDGVLVITTQANAGGKLVTATYQVADLIMPIPDAVLPATQNINDALERSLHPPAPNVAASTTPYVGPYALPPNGSLANAPGSAVGGATVTSSGPVVNKLPTQSTEDQLIRLITSTVAPQTWDSMGGPGNINYYPLGMALVVHQTPDIQEQIADLLAALRRLQDQEVSIEMRFISVAESFYERIGVDFNMSIQNNGMNVKYGPELTTGQFQPAGYINNFNPSRFVTGLTPAGTFTSDLSIPITTSSFAQAVPPFGAFPAIPGGDGGIAMGLAFLSEIQVFLFMEAAQGDERTNVLQAPKLTLANGQTSSITINDQQFFITNVTVLQQGANLAFVPQNTPFPTGVTMVLQAVITADRRFVRINFSGVTLTNLASANVPLFPIVTPIIPLFEGGFQANPVLFTQFLQQPVLNQVSVTTTATIPDGGTVVLGGMKRLSEGRNEFGPPILSKIPYIDRLFRNQAYGKETESLLIMVTPRIIINEEEERIQTGVIATPPP